ncbi:MAG: O-antigen ligase family protein [Roseiflexus sp.]
MKQLHAVPFLTPMILFACGGLLGTLVAGDPTQSLPWMLTLTLGMILYLGIVTFLRNRLMSIATGIGVWSVGYGALLALQYRHLGFHEKLGLSVWLGQLTSAPFPDMTPVFIDANAAASFLAPALPLIVGMALSVHGAQRKAWSIAAALVAFGVLLTSSRGAFVALIAAGILWGLVRFQKYAQGSGARLPRFNWRALIVAGVAGIGLIALLVNLPSTQDALASAALRAEDRLAVYRNSFFLALDFPFSGIGPGVFGLMYSRFQLLIIPVFISYAHNLFLGVWLAQGIIGLIGFAWLLIASLRRTIPTLYAQTLHVQGAVIGCTVLLLHGLSDAPQYDTSWPTMLLAFGLFGIVAAALHQPVSIPIDTTRRPNSRRRAQVWTVIAAIASVLIVIGPHLAAAGAVNYAAWLQSRAMLAGELPQEKRTALMNDAVVWINYGLRIAPDSPLVQKRLGMLALELGDYPRAINALERAQTLFAADQATRKALGMAYVWQGDPDRGTGLLAHLDRADEVREELSIWTYAWHERGRDDLAAYAQRAAEVMAETLR